MLGMSKMAAKGNNSFIFVSENQCEYSNPWVPCKHCETHNNVQFLCLKGRGPKALGPEADPSRRLPTPIDAVIPHEDVLLLHYLYDKNGLETDCRDSLLFPTFLGNWEHILARRFPNLISVPSCSRWPIS
jgi:hypothetical protein